MAKKKTAKRYSDAEKQGILDFIAAHDAKNGRGGASAAMKKFGVAPMTLSNWKKNAKGGASARGAKPVSFGKGNPFSRMGVILDEIAELESDIGDLNKEYAKLRKKL